MKISFWSKNGDEGRGIRSGLEDFLKRQMKGVESVDGVGQTVETLSPGVRTPGPTKDRVPRTVGIREGGRRGRYDPGAPIVVDVTPITVSVSDREPL